MTSAAMIGCFSKIYLSEVTVLKILELKSVPVNGKASVQFIRIDPEDISVTLSERLFIVSVNIATHTHLVLRSDSSYIEKETRKKQTVYRQNI